MKKKTSELNDELRPEYDLKSLLKDGVRGKYAQTYREGTNLVLLEPDVAKAFLDVETTGFSSWFGDRIFEIAILRCRGDAIIACHTPA
jgi:hypothetical protein